MKIKLLLAIAAIGMMAVACEKEDITISTPVSDDLTFSVNTGVAVLANLNDQEVLVAEEAIDTTLILQNVTDSTRFFVGILTDQSKPCSVRILHRGVTLIDTIFAATPNLATKTISYKVGAWFRVY